MIRSWARIYKSIQCGPGPLVFVNRCRFLKCSLAQTNMHIIFETKRSRYTSQLSTRLLHSLYLTQSGVIRNQTSQFDSLPLKDIFFAKEGEITFTPYFIYLCKY